LSGRASAAGGSVKNCFSMAAAFAAQHNLSPVLDVVDDRRSAAIELYERLG
jgi:hypothetical protein